MRKDSKRKYFGNIDPDEKLYYSFKLDATRYMLYDSELGEPVDFGSFNKVAATISNLPKNCIIFYYELNIRDGWKLKRTYRPDNTTVDNQDKKNTFEEVKESKK